MIPEESKGRPRRREVGGGWEVGRDPYASAFLLITIPASARHDPLFILIRPSTRPVPRFFICVSGDALSLDLYHR